MERPKVVEQPTASTVVETPKPTQPSVVEPPRVVEQPTTPTVVETPPVVEQPPVVETPRVVETPQPQAPQQPKFAAKELPNTGTSESDKLVTLSGVGLLGLLGLGFKKCKEEE